jgi:hypothetical protein
MRKQKIGIVGISIRREDLTTIPIMTLLVTTLLTMIILVTLNTVDITYDEITHN